MRERAEIERAVARAFGPRDRAPATSLRGGAALDVYDPAPPFDPALDTVSHAHLDADSWLHYLPLVLVAALARAEDPGNALVEHVVWSLRPPDRDPPRFARLTTEQEVVVAEALEYLAFHPESRNQDLALQVLEEYWIPGASYR
jgi:hypothetical protein